MRYLLALLVFTFSTPAIAQDQCKKLLGEISKIDQQIADIEAERALTNEFRDMIEAMDSAIADLNASKDDAEAYEEKLGEFQDLLGEKFEQVGEVVKGTKAGTAELKEAIGSTSDGIGKAQLAFKLYLEKRKTGDNTNPAESLQTLADSYDFLRESLGPLIDRLPVIGQFLEAYGEALKSAAGVATKLQNIRNNQAEIIDQFPELGGRNPFRFPTEKDKTLENLRAKRDQLADQIEEADCTIPEPEIPEEVAQAEAAARLQCIQKFGLKTDPDTSYFDAIREKDKRLVAFYAAQRAFDDAPGKVSTAEENLTKAGKNVNATEKELSNTLIIYQTTQGATSLTSATRRQSPGFPQQPGDKGCIIAQAIAADGPGTRKSGFSQDLRKALNAYCAAYKFLPEQKEKLEQARTNLAESKTALSTAREQLDNARKLLTKAREDLRRAKNNRAKVKDCVEEQSGPIDISGRYWHRETGAVLTVRRSGPNYQLLYEEVPSRLASDYRVRKDDPLLIGRLKDGKLVGIYHSRYPTEVRSEWGCTNAKDSWVDFERADLGVRAMAFPHPENPSDQRKLCDQPARLYKYFLQGKVQNTIIVCTANSSGNDRPG